MLNEKLWHWFFGYLPKDNRIVRYHNNKKSQEINIEENWVSISVKGPGPFICQRTTTETSVFPTATLDPSLTGRDWFRYDDILAGRKWSFDPRDIVTCQQQDHSNGL